MNTHLSRKWGMHSVSDVSLFLFAAILMTAATAGATDHAGNITTNEIWTAAGNPHNVTANVIVNTGVTLTLEPGVEVYVNNNVQIQVYGMLVANGTAVDRITFDQGGGSVWFGLRFLTTGSGSLTYCDIANASYGVSPSGSGTASLTNVDISDCTYGIYFTNGTLNLASTTVSTCTSFGMHCNGVLPAFLDGNSAISDCATGFYVVNVSTVHLAMPLAITDNTTVGLRIINADDVSVDNLTFTGNTGNNGAMIMEDVGEFKLGAGNTIGGAGLENSWPVTITAGSYLSATSVVPTTGNTNNDIQVTGIGDHPGTWRLFSGLDYVVTGNATFQAGGDLTIADGALVRFNNNQRLTFYSSLTAVGTPGGGIDFVPNSASNWYGLRFLSNSTGTLAYCTLQQASYGLDCSSNATVAVAQTTISDGLYGIYHSNGTLNLTSVTIENCTNTGYRGVGAGPTFLDGGTVIDNCVTGAYVTGVPGLVFGGGPAGNVTIVNNTTAGLRLGNCDDPAVDYVTLTNNTGATGALYMDDVGEFNLGANNVIGGTGLENTWALSLTTGSYPAAGCVIPLTGNTNNDLQVYGGASSRTGTWRKFADLDYIVSQSPTISAGGALTIAEDVDMYFAAGARINVYGDLTAVGTSSATIRFHPSTATNWQSLRFLTAGGGTIAHCHLDQASYGIEVSSSGTVDVANTVIENGNYGLYHTGGTLNVTQLLIQNCNVHGIYDYAAQTTFLDANTVIDNCATGMLVQNLPGLVLDAAVTIQNCTTNGLLVRDCENLSVDHLVLTGNTGLTGAIKMEDTGDFTLGAGNTIGGAGLENTWPVTITTGSFPSASCVIPTSGNVNNDIQVNGGNNVRTGTWRNFPGHDYIVTGTGAIASGGQLTIADEVVLRFENGIALNAYGTLHVAGTSDHGVLMTRNGDNTWYGLRFLTTSNSTVEYCTLEHASYAINPTSDAVLLLSHSLIRDCLYGVHATGGTTELLNNTITTNDYGVYVGDATMVFGDDLTEWNDIYDNGGGADGRNMRNATANDVYATYVFWGPTYWWDIETSIWDVRDDVNLGKIHYIPWVNQAHSGLYSAVDDGEDTAVPARFAVYQNYPNPFNPSTTIAFDLARAQEVSLRIYDVSGRLVRTLLDGPLPAATHRISWLGTDDSGRTVASGVYVYRLTAGDRTETRQMVLVQ